MDYSKKNKIDKPVEKSTKSKFISRGLMVVLALAAAACLCGGGFTDVKKTQRTALNETADLSGDLSDDTKDKKSGTQTNKDVQDKGVNMIEESDGDDFLNPTEGALTSNFGSRWGKTHKGIDIGGESGTEVFAANDGTVVFSDVADGYGNYIIIDHENGYKTAYGHLSTRVANNGDVIKKGQLIGYMGSTGNSTGPHLHFEVIKNGECVDPLKYVIY